MVDGEVDVRDLAVLGEEGHHILRGGAIRNVADENAVAGLGVVVLLRRRKVAFTSSGRRHKRRIAAILTFSGATPTISFVGDACNRLGNGVFQALLVVVLALFFELLATPESSFTYTKSNKGLHRVDGIVAAIVELPPDDIEISEDFAKGRALSISLPMLMEELRIDDFDEVGEVQGIVAELLEVFDVLVGIMTNEDEIAFAVRIHDGWVTLRVRRTIGVPKLFGFSRGQIGRERRSKAGGNDRRSFSQANKFALAKLKASGATRDVTVVLQMSMLIYTEMTSTDLVKPVLATIAWRDVDDVQSIQRGNANLGNLVVVQFECLNVNADENDILVKSEGSRLPEVNGWYLASSFGNLEFSPIESRVS